MTSVRRGSKHDGYCEKHRTHLGSGQCRRCNIERRASVSWHPQAPTSRRKRSSPRAAQPRPSDVRTHRPQKVQPPGCGPASAGSAVRSRFSGRRGTARGLSLLALLGIVAVLALVVEPAAMAVGGRTLPLATAVWLSVSGFMTAAGAAVATVAVEWQAKLAPFVQHPLGVFGVWIMSWAIGSVIIAAIRGSDRPGPWHERRNVLLTVLGAAAAIYAALWVVSLVPVPPAMLAAWGVGSAVGYTVGAAIKLRLVQEYRLTPLRSIRGGLWGGATGASLSWLLAPGAPVDPWLAAAWVMAGVVVGSLPFERYSRASNLRGFSRATLRALSWSAAVIGLAYIEPILLAVVAPLHVAYPWIWAIGGASFLLAATGLAYLAVVLFRHAEMPFAARRTAATPKAAPARTSARAPTSAPDLKPAPPPLLTASSALSDEFLLALYHHQEQIAKANGQKLMTLQEIKAFFEEPGNAYWSDTPIRSSGPEKAGVDRAMMSSPPRRR